MLSVRRIGAMVIMAGALATPALLPAATKIGYVSPVVSPSTPGSVNGLRVQFRNDSPQAGGGIISISVPGHTAIRNTSPLWVPAHSRFRWEYPFAIPGKLGQKPRSLPVTAMLPNTPSARNGTTGNLFIQRQAMRTAVVLSAQDTTGGRFAAAMRHELGLSPAMTFMTIHNFPITAPPLLNIRIIFAATRRSGLNTLQTNALRDWVIAGGRLWINLSHPASRKLAKAILGRTDKLTYIENLRSAHITYKANGLSQIIHLKRSRIQRCYLSGNAAVIETANGWPAVMRYRLGKGQVWLCALADRALITKRGKARAALWVSTRKLFSAPLASKVPGLALHMAAAAIGYRIAGRGSVMVVLGLLILAVLFGGWILARRGAGGLLGIWALCAALGASGVLFALGRMERGPVPQSASAVQVATFHGGQAYVSGQLALFGPRQIAIHAAVHATTASTWGHFLNSQPHCTFAHQSASAPTKVSGLIVPSGKVVHLAYHSFISDAHRHTFAQGVVNAHGIQGDFAAPAPLYHVVIAGPSGIIAARAGSRGQWTAGAGQILPPGQFMTGSLLTRNNEREGAMMAAELSAHPAHGVELMAWSREIPAIWQVNESKLRLCNTLVIAPVALRLPAAGRPVNILWPLVQMRVSRGTHGQMSAPVYDVTTHRWLPQSTVSGNVFFQVSVPASLKNIDATQAHLFLHLTAPDRQVRVSLRDGARWTTIAVMKPGTHRRSVRFDLTPGEFHDATLLVRLHVGYPSQPGESWHFASFRMSIQGKAE